MKRHRQHLDPTAERARTGSVTSALDRLPRETLIVMFAIHVYGLSTGQVTEYFGIPRKRVAHLAYSSLSIMRHPAGAGVGLLQELQDGAVPRSADLPAFLNELGFGEIGAWTCRQCRRPNLPDRGADPYARAMGGRPRQYCSNACRQAAYRGRRSARPSSPGAAGRPQA
ncbi:hypothetical protein [Kitasatospora sp. NPDC057936]|uniref:hypothetical protein n=1 Tax=Kitasatospora sp. NPDC057936 TaxID=3346283 RepID=UPI0036DB3706